MALNMRNDIKDINRELIDLYKNRKIKKNERKKLEDVITQYNDDIIKSLNTILTPISIEYKLNFHLTITDDSLQIAKTIHTPEGPLRFQYDTISIDKALESNDALNKWLDKIKLKILYFKNLLTKTDILSEDTLFFVNTTLDTKTRYF